MYNTRLTDNKRGFTLVELVIVIAILAILAAIAIPVVNSILVTSAKNAALTDAETVESSIKIARSEYGAKTYDTYIGIRSSVCPSLKDVVKVNGLDTAISHKTVGGDIYVPVWNSATEDCLMLKADNAGNYTMVDINGNIIPASQAPDLYQLSTVDASGNIIVANYDIDSWSSGYTGSAL